LSFFFFDACLQTLFKTLAISFSTMTLFTGITPLYGSSLQYAGPASLVWGWVVVSFFTWFVGVAMAEICSSFPVSTPAARLRVFSGHRFLIRDLAGDRFMFRWCRLPCVARFPC
jgi:hypothetical protein